LARGSMVNLFTVLLQCKGVGRGGVTQCFYSGFIVSKYRKKYHRFTRSKAALMKAKKAAFQPPMRYF
jgi:hypothetical protein